MEDTHVLDSRPQVVQGTPETLAYIESLEFWYRHARKEREELSRLAADRSAESALARGEHKKDIDYIGRCLIDQANERGWCNLYDDFVNELNGHILYSLPVRHRDYLVTFDMNVSLEIIVEASSEDEARELAEGQLDVAQFFNYSSFDLGSYHIHNTIAEER